MHFTHFTDLSSNDRNHVSIWRCVPSQQMKCWLKLSPIWGLYVVTYLFSWCWPFSNISTKKLGLTEIDDVFSNVDFGFCQCILPCHSSSPSHSRHSYNQLISFLKKFKIILRNLEFSQPCFLNNTTNKDRLADAPMVQCERLAKGCLLYLPLGCWAYR